MTQVTTVADVVAALERAYPPELAQKWDQVGLICGDPRQEVAKVAFALDCTQDVAEQAVAAGAQMLVVHHPLLMRGVSSVAADTPKGKVIHTLIRAGVALFAAHTNADSARPGVSDVLAELVGITPGRPIVPQLPPGMDKWGINIPNGDVERVMETMWDAGAGAAGDYERSSFRFEGNTHFTPCEGADPAVGNVGEPVTTAETRVEFVAPRSSRRSLIKALRSSHPYEEPAFDIIELVSGFDLESAPGLGRVGELDHAMTLRDFTQKVADALPETCWGVRAAGNADQLVKKVAVSSGSGDSLLDDVTKLGVDVFLTSDLRHHPVDEHLRAGGCAVIDTAHWASEFPWTRQAAGIVDALNVETEIITIRTDPWTVSTHPQT